jgi:leader peptidase (prepilin peptidase)/N-methyltransferase
MIILEYLSIISVVLVSISSFYLPSLGKKLLAYRNISHESLHSYSFLLAILGGVGGGLLFFQLHTILEIGIALLFLFLLLLIGWIDWHTSYIFDQLTIGGYVILVILLAMHDLPSLPYQMGISIVTYLILFAIAKGTNRLGQGDAKLMALCSLMINWQGVLFALWLASISGLLYVVFLFIREKTFSLNQELPFGPHLAFGAFFSYLVSLRCSIFFSCKSVLSTLLAHILY